MKVLDHQRWDILKSITYFQIEANGLGENTTAF
jgi:hypothetical protein